MVKGENLRELRESRSVSQAAIASTMGVTPARVSIVESGRRGPVGPDFARRYVGAVEAVVARREGRTAEPVKIFVHVRGFIGSDCVIEDGETVE